MVVETTQKRRPPYKTSLDKGKPGESQGRKAMGLPPSPDGHDCQAAEVVSSRRIHRLRL
jgi:hypothetical protein